MMNFIQLERHYQLLLIIDQYQRLLTRFETGLNSSRLDGLPHSNGYHIDKIGDIVIRREKIMQKLPLLLALAEKEAPQVEETIKAAAGQGKGAIRVELIMRSRYLNGRDWPEIVTLFSGTDTKHVISLVRKKLEQLEEENEMCT